MNKSTPNATAIAPRRPPITRRTLVVHVVGETTEEVQKAMNDLVNALMNTGHGPRIKIQEAIGDLGVVRHARAHV